MPDLLLLCLNFMKAGLFAVGGGLATLPFLTDMSNRHPEWFTHADLANMVAVSESTPGPMGVNMATYVGYHTHGVPGAILCTLSLILPAFIIILIVARLWQKYKNNEKVQKVFSGLRPAAVGLILAAGFSVFLIALFPEYTGSSVTDLIHIGQYFNWKYGLLFVLFMAATQVPKLKKLHPILYIVIAAVIGIVFQL